MNTNAYMQRGVSATKEDVHNAISNQDKGLYPGAFCKIVDDFMQDPAFCNVIHADGAGTKSIIAYLYYKETGDPTIFRGIAQDSIVMNIDDLLCVGATGPFVLSNTIGRNAHRIDGQVIKEIIAGYELFSEELHKHGIHITMAGGETADVGDLVGTVIVDSTVFTRLKKTNVIDFQRVKSGDVIVGLASFGKSTYEGMYNSGIGSNGLTAARHLILSKNYGELYPETYSATIDSGAVYTGSYHLSDALPNTNLTIGQALLSPTRTYAPIIKAVLETIGSDIHGIVHCTGGGQYKCKSFGTHVHYIKDNLFDTPEIFREIERSGKVDHSEMFQIFNMGHRMEIYCPEFCAAQIITIAKEFGIDAQIIGHIDYASGDNMVTIQQSHV